MRLIDADALTKECGDWYVEEGPEEGFIGTLEQLLSEQPEINCSEFPNNSDTISRQQAIDACHNYEDGKDAYAYGDVVEKRLKTLPSAQPKIIRCKDCKFYGRADKRRFYRGSDCLNNRIDTIVPDRDFCSKAERREE